MASKSSIIDVKVLVDAAQASKLDKAAGSVDNFQQSLTKGLGTAVAAVGLGALGAAAVNAASDLQQAGGAVEAVFKSQAGAVKQYASTSARELGISSGAYQQLASLIGSQLKNAGTSADELAGKTSDLIGVGADLAAQFGGSTADAVSALSSLLRGERDPIERYGVSITQAAVNAEILKQGLDTSTEAAKRAATQQATLSLLMTQTADAVGANAREADTFAGAQMRMQAVFEDTAAAVGTALLPGLGALMQAATDLAPVLEAVVTPIAALLSAVLELPGPLLAVVAATAGWMAFGGKITDQVNRFKTSVEGAGGAGSAFKSVLGTLGKGLALGAAFGALDLIVSSFTDAAAASQAFQANVASLGDALIETGGAMTGAAASTRRGIIEQSEAFKDLYASGVSYADIMAIITGSADERSAAIERNRDALGDLGADELTELTRLQQLGAESQQYATQKQAQIDAEKKAADASKTSAEALAELQGPLADAQAAYDDAAYASAKLAVEQSGLQQALSGVKDAASAANDAAELLGDSIDKLSGRTESMDDATAGWNTQLTNLAQSFADAATAGDLNKDALLGWDVAALTANKTGQDLYGSLVDQEDAYKNLVSSAYSSAAATGDAATATAAARTAADGARAAFLAQATQMGLTDAQAEALADQLGIVNGVKIEDKDFALLAEDAEAKRKLAGIEQTQIKDKRVSVDAETAAAEEELRKLQRTAANMKLSMQVVVSGPASLPSSVPSSVPRGLVGGFSSGGVAGVSRGPVATFPVVSAASSVSAAQSGGVNITVQGALDPDAVARQIQQILRGRDRRTAGVSARTV